MNKRGNLQFNRVAITAFVICALVGFTLTAITKGPRAARDWNSGRALSAECDQGGKAVGRRWRFCGVGHYVGLRGPGIFFIVPVLETLSPYVDQRVRVRRV